LENYIIINETKRNGFKITSYMENLSAEERKKRDSQLGQNAIKLLNEKSISKQLPKNFNSVEQQYSKYKNETINIEQEFDDEFAM